MTSKNVSSFPLRAYGFLSHLLLTRLVVPGMDSLLWNWPQIQPLVGSPQNSHATITPVGASHLPVQYHSVQHPALGKTLGLNSTLWPHESWASGKKFPHSVPDWFLQVPKPKRVMSSAAGSFLPLSYCGKPKAMDRCVFSWGSVEPLPCPYS